MSRTCYHSSSRTGLRTVWICNYPSWVRPNAVRPDNQLIDFPYTFGPSQTMSAGRER